MSRGVEREIIAQAFIVLTACFGGWLIFVQPRMHEINRLEAIVARSAAIQDLMSETEIQSIATRIGSFKSRVRWIRDSGRLARDTSRVYELIMELAVEHGVVVENLRSDVKTDESTNNKVNVTDIHMTVVGNYPSIASFFDALDQVNGLIRPTSLQLSPIQTGGNQQAQARLSCQALEFPLPKVLGEFTGDADGDS